MDIHLGSFGGWSLFVLTVIYPLTIWLCLEGGKSWAERPDKSEYDLELLQDNARNRRLLNGRALVFGDDGEIVECKWYGQSASARAFGGRPSDYYAGWITWEQESVNFKIIGILPVPMKKQKEQG